MLSILIVIFLFVYLIKMRTILTLLLDDISGEMEVDVDYRCPEIGCVLEILCEVRDEFKRKWRKFHFLVSKDVILVPERYEEFISALWNSAVSYKIPSLILNKYAVIDQISKFGMSIMKYPEYITPELENLAVIQCPQMIGKVKTPVTQYMIAVGLVNLPDTYEEVMSLDPYALITCICEFKFDNYDFLKFFPVSFIKMILDRDQSMYLVFPEILKNCEQVLSYAMAKMYIDEYFGDKKMNVALAITLISYCPEGKFKKIRKTLKKLLNN